MFEPLIGGEDKVYGLELAQSTLVIFLDVGVKNSACLWDDAFCCNALPFFIDVCHLKKKKKLFTGCKRSKLRLIIAKPHRSHHIFELKREQKFQKTASETNAKGISRVLYKDKENIMW